MRTLIFIFFRFENYQFAYAVVGFHGSGIMTYREALAAVFLEGQAGFYFFRLVCDAYFYPF
jgi:hypothetical protein